MIPLFQFWYSHAKRAFKNPLKEKWEELDKSGDAKYTENRKFGRASFELLSELANDVKK